MATTAALVLSVAMPASALEFRMIGPRALSMGGAGVARPENALASYYNPAALAEEPGNTAVSVVFGIGVRDTGIAGHINNLTGYDWNTAIGNPASQDALNIIGEIVTIQADDGLMFMPGATFGLKIGKFGTGVFGGGEMAVYTAIDAMHINSTDPLTDPNSFAYNDSALYARGLVLAEIPFAYGHTFPLEAGRINVGGALKLIPAATYNIAETVTADFEDVEDHLLNGDNTDTGFGMDLGVQYIDESEKLAAGLVLRNINSPSFATANSGQELSADMQARAGVAYTISDKWSAAADLDLTANETMIGGYKSRQLGGGLACQLTGGISARFGMLMNLEGGQPVWCLGLSLGAETIRFDIAGAIAGSNVTVDEYSFPSEGHLLFSLDAEW